jgi:para-aminobenzoate synthetase component II
MILMIDNYDSFTYNLVQAFGELGADLRVYRNDALTVRDVEALAPEHIVISPGPCTPNEAGVSLEVIRHFAGKIPLLGVCLGHQAITQAFGGRVVRAPEPTHGKTAKVRHTGQGVFWGLEQDFVVARYHSLVAEASSLPECLEVTATYQGLVMGLRHRWLPHVEGVQFHPESFIKVQGPKVLRNFLDYQMPATPSRRDRAPLSVRGRDLQRAPQAA